MNNFLADLTTGHSLGNQLQHFNLSTGQGGPSASDDVTMPEQLTNVREQLRCHHWRNHGATSDHLIDAVDELRQRRVLDDIPTGPRLDGREQIFLGFARRQQHNAGVWRGVADLVDDIEAGQAGHQYVEYDDVGLELASLGNCGHRVLRLTGHVKACLVEGSRDASLKQWSVVYDEY